MEGAESGENAFPRMDTSVCRRREFRVHTPEGKKENLMSANHLHFTGKRAGKATFPQLPSEIQASAA